MKLLFMIQFHLDRKLPELTAQPTFFLHCSSLSTLGLIAGWPLPASTTFQCADSQGASLGELSQTTTGSKQAQTGPVPSPFRLSVHLPRQHTV